MISFTILNEENIGGIEVNFTSDYPDADGEYLRDILYSLAEDDCEVAVSQSHGCLLVRLYDEGYSFIYPIALTDGLEALLNPLKVLKVPVHELAMMMTIALRFIPTLIDETDKIINAQKARGADFETGGLFKRMKAIIPILIPLLISAFRRADELGDAMDARCYSGSKVLTKFKKLKYGVRDLVAFIIAAALIVGVVLLR